MIKANSHHVRGSTGGGRNHVERKARGADYRANALSQAERGELRTRCRQQMNVYNQDIPTTTNPRSPTRPGGGTELLPRQGPICPGGPQHGHRTLKGPSGTIGCIFIGVLWDCGPLGSFSTMPSLMQPTDVVAGLLIDNYPIPV